MNLREAVKMLVDADVSVNCEYKQARRARMSTTNVDAFLAICAAHKRQPERVDDRSRPGHVPGVQLYRIITGDEIEYRLFTSKVL